MKIKTVLAWTAIFFISIIPALMLLIFGYGNQPVIYTVGRVAGLIGMTMFSLTLVLSTRARWIDEMFDGIDKAYPVHAALGATSLILLLLHPIFLLLRFIPYNVDIIATYLLPGGALSVDFGIYALIGMIVLLFITIYGQIRYNRWKISHEFLGLMFILAILHIILIRKGIAVDAIFPGYMLFAVIVSSIGLLAFLYSLERSRIIGKKYQIKKVKKVSQCYDIELEPKGEHIRYKSGQFIFVRFHNAKLSNESHPFSIASGSDDKDIRIIMKSLGDYTNALGNLKEGDEVIVEGPYGRFHKKEFSGEIWIAGGIGITPFLGLAKDIAKTEGHIDLFYSVKIKDEFIGLGELEQIASKNKNLRIHKWIASEKGYITAEDISKVTSIEDKEVYICGPQALKDAIRKDLSKRGVSKDRIHDEMFAFK